MRYVAFDIESANSDPDVISDMSEFGYVVADEDFIIVEKKLIRIKPRKVGNWNKEAYGIDDSDFKDCLEFSHNYQEIKKILEFPEQMIFAHSAKRDLVFLGRECRRNKLDAPRIEVFDTVTIYKKYWKIESGDTNLPKTAE